MNLKNKLLLEELATKIIYNWDLVQECKLAKYNLEMNKWRIELYSYIKDAPKEELDYVLSYIYENGPAKMYLEMNELVVQYKIEKNDTKLSTKIQNYFSSKIQLIRNLLTGENTNEQEICTNNSICVWGSSDVNSETGSNRST